MFKNYQGVNNLITQNLLKDIDENKPQLYLDKGYIDVKDEVAFKRIYEACNCFGHKYKGFMKGGAKHPYRDDVTLWFPKMYSNGAWKNSISADENTIWERPEDPNAVNEHIEFHIERDLKRIVFSHEKDRHGKLMYRFKGEYEIDKKQSRLEKCLVWKRVTDRVDTYPPKG
jgi:hypothetical protein